MLVVHVALHLGGNAADFFGPQVAVQCWKLYGDKTNIQRNEHIFQIVTALIVISGQSGKVFDDYAVNFFCVDVGQKPLKILPVAVGSRPAIVLIVAYHLDFRVLGQIVVQYGVFVLNAVTYVVPVLFGKPFVFSSLPHFFAVLCECVVRRFSSSFRDTSSPL